MMQNSGKSCRGNAFVRHCEEPTGPREARPDNRLRDQAIQTVSADALLDCFASLAMTVNLKLNEPQRERCQP
jgi:hypothetical protein